MTSVRWQKHQTTAVPADTDTSTPIPFPNRLSAPKAALFHAHLYLLQIGVVAKRRRNRAGYAAPGDVEHPAGPT